jgi:xylan 1,4-beta-xylosidase
MTRSRDTSMGMPKVLDAAQPGNVQRATADVPEQDRIVMTDASGSASATVPMQSNDVALWPATY